MNRDEIDTLLSKAIKASVNDGEEFTRYHFAALVAEAEREAIIDLVAMYGGSVDLEAAIRARGQA